MKSILIVDDEPIVRLDLALMLKEHGYSVVGEASDGFDAVELCRTAHPDIVLMDVDMPVFGGLDAAEQILRDGLSHCVIILSAYFEDSFVQRASEIGVTGYLTKPIEPHRFPPSIEIAYAHSQRLHEAQVKVQESKKQVETFRLIERAKGMLSREKGISEADAYRQMQKLAMDKRCSIEMIARSLVARDSGRELVQEAKQRMMKRHGISEQSAYRRLCQMAEKKGVSQAEIARQILAKE